MQTLAITRHVAYGCPPEPFTVTFTVGAGEHLVTVRGRGQVQQLRWSNKGYRPGSAKLTEKAVDHFLRRLGEIEAGGGPDVEAANVELASVARSPHINHRPCPADRQLPSGDRV